MLTKHRLLTISLLLPFMAISSVVHANHNYKHRPNQPAGMMRLTKLIPHRQLPRRNYKGLRRRNSAILIRSALIKGPQIRLVDLSIDALSDVPGLAVVQQKK